MESEAVQSEDYKESQVSSSDASDISSFKAEESDSVGSNAIDEDKLSIAEIPDSDEIDDDDRPVRKRGKAKIIPVRMTGKKVQRGGAKNKDSDAEDNQVNSNIG
jgi:hypothetical protein